MAPNCSFPPARLSLSPIRACIHSIGADVCTRVHVHACVYTYSHGSSIVSLKIHHHATWYHEISWWLMVDGWCHSWTTIHHVSPISKHQPSSLAPRFAQPFCALGFPGSASPPHLASQRAAEIRAGASPTNDLPRGYFVGITISFGWHGSPKHRALTQQKPCPFRSQLILPYPKATSCGTSGDKRFTHTCACRVQPCAGAVVWIVPSNL